MGSHPVPPDGGWGWVVVVVTFVAHTITHGVVYSFGVIFGSLQHRYGTDNAATSWVAALAIGCLFLAGPLASCVTTKYGCRTASVTGAVLSASGIVIAALVPSVYALYLGYGIMAGVGYGLVFLSSIVSVNQYFDKRRSIACTLSMSGCAAGAFIFSPLVTFCLDTYGIQGTMLLEGAVLLNCVVSGAALIPIGAPNARSNNKLLDYDVKYNKPCIGINSGIPPSADCVSLNPREKEVVSLHSASSRANVNGDFSKQIVHIKHSSLEHIKYSSLDDMNNILSSSKLGHSASSMPSSYLKSDPQYLLKQSLMRASRWNSDYMMFSSQSMAAISKLSIDEEMHSKSLPASEHDDGDNPNSICAHVCLGVWPYLIVFKEIAFVTFLLVQAFLHMGVYLPFIYLPSLAISAGISEYTAAWIVSMTGVSSIVARVFFGFIGDLACVDRRHLLSSALLVSGISTSFVPFYHDTASLMTYAVVYGAFVGVAISLSPVVLTDLVGLPQLPRAFGIVNMFCGIACLLGPPLAGLAYDRVGSYDVSFPVAGALMVAGSVLMYATSCINLWR